jgi:uncharacterized iron-regulated membrane protein
MKRLLRIHRWLGLIACVGVLMWGLSGITHPIMSRLQPRPVVATPPVQAIDLKGAQPIAEVLRRHGIGEFETLRAIDWNGGVYYQIGLPGKPEKLYLDARTGAVLADGDCRYAEHLARHFLADTQSKVASVERVQDFDGEYNYVNRLLPVYRVTFDRPDRIRAYIDTAESRLGTLIDETKAWMAALFRTLHNWEFIAAWPRVQLAVMSVFLVSAFVTATLGIVLYGFLWTTVKQRLKKQKLRRTHRGLGIAVSVTTLTFTFSGTFHLFKSFERDREVHPLLEQRFTVADVQGRSLPTGRYTRVALTRLVDGAYFQLAQAAAPVAAGEHDHHQGNVAKTAPTFSLVYRHARTGRALDNGIDHHVRQLAAFYSGLPHDKIISVKPITRFEDEYGFIFKRLPVYRVEFDTPGHDRYYVEPATGALAAKIDDDDALEGKTFSYLHKWHVTDKGKDLRDSLLALFALGNVAVALMGLMLFLRRQRSAPRRSAK